VSIVPFVGQQQGRSPNFGACRYLNLYPHQNLDGSIGILGTPGHVPVLDIGSSPIRGLHVFGGALYAVAFDSVYRIPAGTTTQTLIGTLDTRSGHVSMADNGTELFIVDGQKGYMYTHSTTDFVTVVDCPASDTACFIDGYFVVSSKGTNTYFYSGLYDGSDWNALNYNAAEASSDNVVAVAATFGFLYVFGDRTLEIWYNAGDPDSVFRRADGMVGNTGCAAPHSIARVGETGNELMWLSAGPQGAGYVVGNKGGSQVARLSTPAAEYAWSQYRRIDDATAFSYTQEGHVFYVITFPTGKATWAYDTNTQTWHQRSSMDGAALGATYAYWDDMHVVGSRVEGMLYRLDLGEYTDGGSAIIRELIGPTMGTDQAPLSYRSVQIDMERGESFVPFVPPEYSSVKFLVHGNGATGGQVIVDAIANRTITITGGVTTDTSESKFGGGSLFFPSDGYLTLADSPDFGFGMDDWTIEAWVYRPGVVFDRVLFDFRSSVGTRRPMVRWTADELIYFTQGAVRISIPGFTEDTWHHVAVCRKSGVTTMYLDGVPGTPWVDTLNYGSSSAVTIGATFEGDLDFNGWVDEIRLSKRYAHYAGAFTPPTAAFLEQPRRRDPEILLSWSDDAGHTWVPDVQGGVGKTGDFTRRVVFRRLGRSFRRTFRLRITDPIKVAILAATIDYSG
jgi:hypothetical protein